MFFFVLFSVLKIKLISLTFVCSLFFVINGNIYIHIFFKKN